MSSEFKLEIQSENSGASVAGDESFVVSVAVPRPVGGLFTYRVKAEQVPALRIGGCVRVPFGRTTTHAFVVEPPRSLSEASESLPEGLKVRQLKEVLEVIDSDLFIPTDVMALCRWAHEYYSSPLGMVLNCAFSGRTSGSKSSKGKPRTQSKSKVMQAPSPVSVQLTEEQSSSLALLESFRDHKTFPVALLHGVTGSGKTEIYVEMARKMLSQGKGVLILVPEIALTPQLYKRFEERLGVPIALWHSAISDGRKRSQSLALHRGEIRIVIGARSAVFAPVPDLGLVIVDEEHDATYKQEDRVRYQARDLSIVRAKQVGAFTVLGSATPSLETRERVKEGRFGLAELKQRIAPGGFPIIEYIDLRYEDQVQSVQAPLAKKTVQKIQEVLDSGEQVIVYLNRRGFAAFLLCGECGDVRNCPRCSISLTVHKRNSGLECHLCGHKERVPDFCQKCQGTDLQPMGPGTESLEEELGQLLSGAKILRLDRDQITSASRLEKALNEFRSRSANVLLGTQMLVKGHDFPGVTLVVVVLADALFRWPDFRAPERAYQVLLQVAGRSGRGEKAGKVLVQTFDTEHPVLKVLDGRVTETEFLSSERELREVLGYPPFGRMARLRFEDPVRSEAVSRASEIAVQLMKRFESEVSSGSLELLGPSEAFLEKVNGIFRWDLILKTRNPGTRRNAAIFAQSYCASKKWHLSVDIDPHSN